MTCRICLEDHNTSDNKLIVPCNCKGSIEYIHEQCLQEWRYHSKFKNKCNICDSDYQTDYIIPIRGTQVVETQVVETPETRTLKNFSKTMVFFFICIIISLNLYMQISNHIVFMKIDNKVVLTFRILNLIGLLFSTVVSYILVYMNDNTAMGFIFFAMNFSTFFILSGILCVLSPIVILLSFVCIGVTSIGERLVHIII